MDMNNYYKYFLKGWWAQLLILLINIATIILIIPIVITVGGSSAGYYVIYTIAYIFIIVPIGGLLFVKFAASHIKADKERGEINVTK